MVDSYVQAGQGQLLCAVINGVDLTSYCHVLRVYESICKEYITAQLIFYDSDNIIENMQIQAGTPAGFSFWSPPNSFVFGAGQQGPNFNNGTGSYGNMAVLKMKGSQAPDTLKYSIYTIDLIGQTWYSNMNTQIMNTSTGQTGTSLIQSIWNQYLPDTLNIQSTSIGFLGSQQNPRVAPGLKPLTAIQNIMREMISVQSSQLSNWVLYKNRNGVNLAQLPDLFSINGINGPVGYQPPQASAQGQTEYFVQKETWGANMTGQVGGGLNDPFIYHAIIAIQAQAREGTGSGGTASGVNIAGTTNTQQFVQDIASGNIVSQPTAALGFLSSIGGFISSFGSLIGAGAAPSIAGNQITNSTIWPNATAPYQKTSGEVGYSGAVKGAAQMVMKVPLQTGINVTVGNGIFAYLLPGGIGTPGSTSLVDNVTGPWLVTDLCHECYTDQRQNACTTTFALNQGPINGSGLGS